MNEQPNAYLEGAAEEESNEFDLREESKRVQREEQQLREHAIGIQAEGRINRKNTTLTPVTIQFYGQN